MRKVRKMRDYDEIVLRDINQSVNKKVEVVVHSYLSGIEQSC